MLSLRRFDINTVIYLLGILQLPLSDGKAREECPIGFKLAPSGNICYSLKVGPEMFSEKFKNCTGNLYSLQEYYKLELPKLDYALWTDYKSQYSGGPYFDTSDTGGDILDTTYEVHIGKSMSLHEKLCVVIDPVNNFTAVHCDEKHYRYCFVESYSSSVVSCSKADKGKRFFAPFPTCLFSLKNTSRRAPFVANWNQTQLICKEKGGTIMGRGWRYFNKFNAVSGLVPLNIISDPGHTMLRYDDDEIMNGVSSSVYKLT